MPKYIRLYGARRTGTTWSRELFKSNFKNIVIFNNEFGSKHQPPKTLDEINLWIETIKSPTKDRYLDILSDIKNGNKMKPYVIIKNPYTWYYSIKKWADSAWNGRFDLSSQYESFNKVYSLWRNIENELYDKPYFMRYEDLLINPKLIYDVSEFFSIEIKNEFVNPTKIDCSVGTTSKFKEKYLNNNSWKNNTDLISEITNLVDWNLMSLYGYKPMEV